MDGWWPHPHAAGLDPNKGIEVMLKTDGHYTASSRPPEVVWARQVDAEAILDEGNGRGRWLIGRDSWLAVVFFWRIFFHVNRSCLKKMFFASDSDDIRITAVKPLELLWLRNQTCRCRAFLLLGRYERIKPWVCPLSLYAESRRIRPQSAKEWPPFGVEICWPPV